MIKLIRFDIKIIINSEIFEEKLSKVQEIIARYPEGKQKSALLPVLHLHRKNLVAG